MRIYADEPKTAKVIRIYMDKDFSDSTPPSQSHSSDSFLNESYSELPEVSARQFVESLPNTRSFEHFIYENRAQRVAVHQMDETSITFNKETLKTQIPPELSAFFENSDTLDITNLKIVHVEDPEYCDTTIHFTVNSETHSLITRNEEGKSPLYSRPNSYGDIVSYETEQNTPLQLLAALLYMREYQKISGDQEFDLDESALAFERIGESDLIERIIMTLGHFDGTSSTSTQALIPVDEQMLMVNLSSIESPRHTHNSNEIDLSLITESDGTRFDAIGLSQQIADIKKFIGEEFNDQYSEVQEHGENRIVTPEEEADWNRLCIQFEHAIRPALRNYAYLDDSSLNTIPIDTIEE